MFTDVRVRFIQKVSRPHILYHNYGIKTEFKHNKGILILEESPFVNTRNKCVIWSTIFSEKSTDN